MKDRLLRSFISAQNKIKGFLNPEKVVLKADPGETYVDTGVKVVIAIVIGSLLLVGFIALTSTTILPTLTAKIVAMFAKTAPMT